MKHNVGNMDKGIEENTKTCLRDKRLLCTTYPQRPGPLPNLKIGCVSRGHDILLKPPMVQSDDAKTRNRETNDKANSSRRNVSFQRSATFKTIYFSYADK